MVVLQTAAPPAKRRADCATPEELIEANYQFI